MADERVTVSLVADNKQFITSMDRAATSMTKVDKAAASVGTRMGDMAKGFALAAATDVAVRQLKGAVDMAINLQDSISKVGVVFGKSAGEIEAFADDSSRAFGLTKTAALDATSTFAIFGKAAGLAGSDLTKFSIDLTQRAVNLSSFFGGSVQDAITAMGAALRGESEPIRNYGVLLDDATLRARALKMGLIDSVKEGLTPQTRAIAAAAEVMDQSKDAAGDYERTMGGAANSMKEFSAQWGRLKETFGTELLPMLTSGAQGLSTLIGWFGKASKALDMFSFGMFNIGTLTWWQKPIGWLIDLVNGSDEAASSVDNLGAAANETGAKSEALANSVLNASGAIGGMGGAAQSAADELNGLIDAQQALAGTSDALLGLEDKFRDSARQTGAARSGASDKATQKVIDGIRKQDAAEVEAEINRARRRAQAKADAAADRGARGDTQAGVKGAIDTDKAARAGRDIDGSKQRGTVGEATGTLSKTAQKKLDKEIEAIRARHKKSLDAQVKGLEGTSKATDTYSFSLDRNTEAGRANRATISDAVDEVQSHAQAVYNAAISNGKSAEEAGRLQKQALLDGYDAIMKSADAAGFASDKVRAYLEYLDLIPSKIETLIKVNVDTSAMDAAVKRFGPGEGKVWNPNLGAWMPAGPSSGPEYAPGVPAAAPWQQPRPKQYTHPKRAGGGEIHGPGGPRSDSVPVWASAGEFMVNAPQYAANRDLVRAINAGHGPVSGGGFNIGTITVNETTSNGVRASVIDALAESAYRSGAVR